MISPGLQDDQWHQEARLWFETGLAKFQLKTAEFANILLTVRDGTAYQMVSADAYSPFPELNAALESQCSQQRIRSQGQVQNLKVLYLALELGLSLLLFLLGEFLPQIGFWFWDSDMATIPNATPLEKDSVLGLWRASVDPEGQVIWLQDNIYVARDVSDSSQTRESSI